MSFLTNNESGYPSGFDYYSIGSEETAKSHIQTPQGLTNTTTSARVNPHQNPDDTRPVGMPGTTYTPSRQDKIIMSEGGHAIVMGNAAGSETLRMQSKHGAVVEMSSDGRMLMSAPSGFHVSIGGDGHLVFSGDVHIVTNGDIRFKSSDVHFDCHNFNVHASGDMINNIHGSKNESIVGDSHSTTQGDASTTVGGSTTHATAGNMKIQASGDMDVAAKGKGAYGSVGDCTVSSQGNLNTTAYGDTTVSSHGKTSVNSEGDVTVTGKAKATIAAGGEVKLSGKGKATIVGNGVDLGGSGALKMSGSTIDAQSGANKASPDWVGGGSASAPSADDANPEVKKPDIVVPDEKQILDNVGDYVGTEGGIDKIYSSSQLDHAFNTEEGGTIPDKVMAKAKAMGAIDDSYKAPKGEAYQDGNGFAMSTYSSGMSFNPDV
jgi:hypothetical protein